MEELTKKDILTILGENLTDIRHSGYKTEYSEEEDLDEMPLKPVTINKKTGQPQKNKSFPASSFARGLEPPIKNKKKEGKDFSPFKPLWDFKYTGEETTDPKTGETKKVISNESEHIGFYYTSECDADGEDCKTIPIIYSCDEDDWKRLIEGSPDLINKLKEKFDKVKYVTGQECPAFPSRSRNDSKLVVSPIPGDEGDDEEIDKPIPKTFTTTDDDPEKGGIYTKGKIKTAFDDELNKVLSNDKLRVRMKQLSIPPLFVIKGSNLTSNSRDTTPHLDSHSVTNNELIEFATHSIQLYPTQQKFLDGTKEKAKSKKPEELPDMKTTALTNRYNRVYRKNSVTRMTQKGDYGKTEIFGLDKYRVPEENFEVIVDSNFSIKGEATNKDDDGRVVDWLWTLDYKLNYGKRTDNETVVRELETDEDVKKTVSVSLPEPKKFDGKYEKTQKRKEDGKVLTTLSTSSDRGEDHPLKDENILEGLRDVLNQFYEVMMGRNKFKSVQNAMITLDELPFVPQQQSQMNEDEIRDFVKQTLLNK